MKDNRDSIDFRNEEIGKLFGQFFFPTLLGMVFNMAFIITDGIFVGHGIGPQGLAAINLVGPIMMLINGLGMMFGVGVSVVAAIHLAKGNTKAARLNTTQAFIAGTMVSVLIGTLCYCFPHTVLTLLGADGTLSARIYLTGDTGYIDLSVSPAKGASGDFFAMNGTKLVPDAKN